VGDSHSRNRETDGLWEPYTLTQNFEVPVTISNCTETTAVVSDLPYACIDARPLYIQPMSDYSYNEFDEYPELKMGRITADDSPLNDDDENDNRDAEAVMNDIAEKIRKYEENTTYDESWRERFVYYFGFYEDYANWTPEYSHIDSYLDQQGYTHDNLFAIDYYYGDLTTDCRQDFIDMLSDGTSERVICVHQHGDPRGFLAHQVQGDDGIFVVHNDTVEDIDVGNDLPVVYASTCSTADFCEYFYSDEGDEDGLDNRCIAETWLRRPDNGILAYYGFTQLSSDESTTWVYDLLFRDYVTELGQHWHELTILDTSDRFISILLGDPASDIGDTRIAPTRPNLSVSWARVEFSDRDSYYDDGDWPWLDAGDHSMNISVDVVNTGGAASPATTMSFTYYKVDGATKTPYMTIDTANIPSLDPGETYVAHATCDVFVINDPLHPTDWEYDFVVKAQVTAVANETNTDDNSVWYPDDDVESFNETHYDEYNDKTYNYSDSFDPQKSMTFYSLNDGWPSVPRPAPFPSSLGNYSCPVVLADLDLDGEDEIIVKTTSGYLSVFSGDGSTISGWPKYVGRNASVPSVGDIDADSSLEIVCYADGKLRAFNHDGSTVLGWSTPLSKTIITDIVVANLDGTGKDEILFGAGNYLYAYNGNKTPYTSWTNGRIDLEQRLGNLSVTNLVSSSSTLEVLYYCTPTVGGSKEHVYGCYDSSGTNLFEETISRAITPYALDLGGSSDLEAFYETDNTGELEAFESDGDEYGSFTATTDGNELIVTDIVHGTIGSGLDAVEVIAIIAADGVINAWDLQGLDVATAENTNSRWSPLIADLDGTNGPDFVGVYDDGMVRAFEFEDDVAEAIDEYTFTIHESSIQMGAIGNIDDDDEAEFVFTAGDKVIALELEGLASDIQWGQYRHDASHDNAN